MAGLLTEDQIKAHLFHHPDWQRKEMEISRTFELKNFVLAMGFVNSVAILAEKANHHPDIDIRWNKVTLTLSTHSAGGLTEKDFQLAKAIDEL
jgi:4a-hydroxytetrahydrobiopterin dehydratase